MDSNNNYKPLAIPPRNTKPKDNHPSKQQSISLTDDNNFAEIEYEIAPSVRLQAIRPQTISEQPRDPIQEKFTTMRRIFYDNPYSRNDAELFYKQMLYMKDFEDDYPDIESFSMYYPNYQFMGYKQLRTYFTWRSGIRRGQYTSTSLSYIFVYIYELLANVGVDDPAHGLLAFLQLWQALRDDVPVLDKYFVDWLKDYHIYYNLDFVRFVKDHNLTTVYPENFLFEATKDNCLKLWNAISSYNVTKSIFYKGEQQELLHDCFYKVIQAIEDLCAKNKTDIGSILTHEIYMSIPWRPFNQALFYPWQDQLDRKLVLPGKEVYYCKNNIWTADIFMYQARRGEIAGYIIKKTEECLRNAVGYKYKLTAYTKNTAKAFRGFKKNGFTRLQLDAVIEKAVNDYHVNTKRTVVVVDIGNLDRIRQEAQGTQDLLVVPDIINNNTENMVSDTVLKNPKIVETKEFVHDDNISLPQPTHVNSWEELKQSLSVVELEALSALLTNNNTLKAFADENNIMLEVLLDCINEKAVDCVGDNILDEDFQIYDDYINNVVEMVE